MHEMTLVSSVVNIVLDECEGKGILAVTSVHLTIGDARDVVDEMVPGLFRHLARGTIAENAEIVIRHVPVTVRCNQCGKIFPINVRDEASWSCPRCGAWRDYKMFSGVEFLVDGIEVIGADVPALAS